MMTGNKGEWSEVYTLLKLSGDGVVYAGDGELNKTQMYFPIDAIIRKEVLNKEPHDIIYDLKKNRIVRIGNQTELELNPESFKLKADELFNALSSASGGSKLTFPEIETFLQSIACDELKAKSTDKADVKLIIHDLRIGRTQELGFSIKSKLGGSSTLFNASKDATNFLFKVEDMNDELMTEFNAINKDNCKHVFQSRFELLNRYGAKVIFDKVVSKVFNNNLLYQDTALPEIWGNMVLAFYSEPISRVSDLCERIKEMNPLNFDLESGMDFYTFKIKQFLVNTALGMTAGTPWNGKYMANGGYLVVKEDGDILCYHFYDKNDLEDYLFFNTKLETPSTTRHGFGTIFKDGANYFLKLNLQIRFIH